MKIFFFYEDLSVTQYGLTKIRFFPDSKKRKNNWWDNCVQPSTNKEERICIKSQPLAARDKEK